jgi:hypothetical protein
MPEPAATALRVPELEDGPPAKRVSRFSLAVAALLALGAIAAFAFSLHGRGDAKPNVLFAYPAGSSSTSDVAGRTVYMDADIQPDVVSGHEVLDIASIEPIMRLNTAAATVVIEQCMRTPGAAGVGAVSSTSGLCVSTPQFQPGHINIGNPIDQIIYAITPTRPGTVRITGSDVTYRVGGRRGTQHAGVKLTVTVRKPKK